LFPNAIDLEWITAYGLPGDQFATGIYPTEDGGFILVGNTVADDLYSALVLKLRADGLMEWQKSIAQVRALDVLETSSGDFILAGDLHWIKLDSQGNMLWQHTFEQPAYHTGRIIRLVEESNGDIMVEAEGSRTVFNAEAKLQSFTELDPQTDPGNVIDGLDESQLEELVFVETTADGGAIVGNRIIEDYGIVADMVSYVLFSRFSADGSLRWQRGYGGYFLASYDDVHAFETQSGDIIVAGTLSYFANQADRNDLWMLRLDRDGKSRWDKLYATEGEDPEGQDAVVVVQELSNGDLIFAGQTSGAGTGDQDLWALRTNAQGEIPNCGLVLDGSAGSFGNFPEVETTPIFEGEQGDYDDGEAQAIPLCPPSP
jgi:hypothetical protein